MAETSAMACFDRFSFQNPHFYLYIFQSLQVSVLIESFLRLSTYLPRELSEVSRKAFDAGNKFCSLPYLIISDSGDRVVVDTHEGRHRSKVLLDNGYTTMPVVIFYRHDEPNPKPWPEKIHAQEDAEDPEFSICFPSPLSPHPCDPPT
jgi:hypothetical protein